MKRRSCGAELQRLRTGPPAGLRCRRQLAPPARSIWSGTTGAGWQPIGDKDDYGGRFNARFDGNGHAIANLHINRTSPSAEPPAVWTFWLCLAIPPSSRDTGVINASVGGLEKTGLLTGLNMGEIRDIYVNGSLAASGKETVYTPGGRPSLRRGQRRREW